MQLSPGLIPGLTQSQHLHKPSKTEIRESQTPFGSFLFCLPAGTEAFRMDIETTGLVLCVVLPLYPALFAIYEKIGKYEVICAEFAALREEHDKLKGEHHGTGTHQHH